jgi:hypothetical protein
MLGKRKRETFVAARGDRDDSAESSSGGEVEDGAEMIFKSYFEAQFAPLESGAAPLKTKAERTKQVEELEEDSGSEWSGFSADETQEVEVVSHVGQDVREKDEIEKLELKAFMVCISLNPNSDSTLTKSYLQSSRPPSTSSSSTKNTKQKPLDDEDPKSEAANLANDLALQRLLRESHLFSSNPTSQLSHSGSSRHRAIDLRLQSLGSKDSVFKQQKMPLAHRKGIVEKGAMREGKRRRDAKENGIVLERKGGKERRKGGRRELEVDGPGVGRWKEGMLRLSGRDVRDIEGPKERGKGKKGRRR